jgi:hypothetical protein
MEGDTWGIQTTAEAGNTALDIREITVVVVAEAAVTAGAAVTTSSFSVFRAKQKGEFSFEDSPLLSDLSKIWFGNPDHNWLLLQIRSVPASGARASHPSSAITFAVRAFSGSSLSTQLPECLLSLVADSPDGPLSTLSYWKIAPPLIRKVLAISAGWEEGFELYFCGNAADFVEMETNCLSR